MFITIRMSVFITRYCTLFQLLGISMGLASKTEFVVCCVHMEQTETGGNGRRYNGDDLDCYQSAYRQKCALVRASPPQPGPGHDLKLPTPSDFSTSDI